MKRGHSFFINVFRPHATSSGGLVSFDLSVSPSIHLSVCPLNFLSWQLLSNH